MENPREQERLVKLLLEREEFRNPANFQLALDDLRSVLPGANLEPILTFGATRFAEDSDISPRKAPIPAKGSLPVLERGVPKIVQSLVALKMNFPKMDASLAAQLMPSLLLQDLPHKFFAAARNQLTKFLPDVDLDALVTEAPVLLFTDIKSIMAALDDRYGVDARESSLRMLVLRPLAALCIAVGTTAHNLQEAADAFGPPVQEALLLALGQLELLRPLEA